MTALANVFKPQEGTISNPPELLRWAVRVYDAMAELRQVFLPSRSPALKAITVSTLAALRLQVGDPQGELGPRVCLLAGGATVLDGSQDIYAWDYSSTLPDDGWSVIQPITLNVGQVGITTPGRWRRMTPAAAYGTAGATVASATTLLPGPGKTVPVSGAIQIDYISTAGRKPGNELRLELIAGLTFRHNIAAPPAGSLNLFLAGAVNYAAPALSTIDFVWNARTAQWREVSRSV